MRVKGSNCFVLLAKFGRQQFNKEQVTVDGEYSIRIFCFHNDNHHNASRFKRKEKHASHGLPRSTISLVMSLLTQQFSQTTAGHTQVRNKGKFSRQYTNYWHTFFLLRLTKLMCNGDGGSDVYVWLVVQLSACKQCRMCVCVHCWTVLWKYQRKLVLPGINRCVCA